MTTPTENDPFAGWDAPFQQPASNGGGQATAAPPPQGPHAAGGGGQVPPQAPPQGPYGPQQSPQGGGGFGPPPGPGGNPYNAQPGSQGTYAPSGSRSRTSNQTRNNSRTYNLNLGGNGGGGQRGGGNTAAGGGGGGAQTHQGDGLIHAIERIEITSDKDILAMARAINHLGRELHLILGMRAEEIQGVLSTYKGRWYTFGAGSRVKARLVAAHLKVSAEAAKAIGVGALKMAHAFNRHFVEPEREARRQRQAPARKTFTIGDD